MGELETILNWASSTGRNNNDMKDCEQALSLIITNMMSENQKELATANSRWDKLSDDWNSYRQTMGLDVYTKRCVQRFRLIRIRGGIMNRADRRAQKSKKKHRYQGLSKKQVLRPDIIDR